MRYYEFSGICEQDVRRVCKFKGARVSKIFLLSFLLSEPGALVIRYWF